MSDTITSDSTLEQIPLDQTPLYHEMMTHAAEIHILGVQGVCERCRMCTHSVSACSCTAGMMEKEREKTAEQCRKKSAARLVRSRPVWPSILCPE